MDYKNRSGNRVLCQIRSQFVDVMLTKTHLMFFYLMNITTCAQLGNYIVNEKRGLNGKIGFCVKSETR